MKRFYQHVTVAEVDGGYGIFLDGKPVKTPAKNILICANENIANVLAAEWEAQKDAVLPDTMPANQIFITAIDNLRDRKEIERHICNFIDTDMVCYRSDQSPYRETQAQKWDGFCIYFTSRTNIDVRTTGALAPITQDKAAHEHFAKYVSALDLLNLIVFETMVEETSSPLIALSFMEGHVDAATIYDAVMADDMIKAEIYDEELYGAAPDQEKKRVKMRAVFDAAEKLRDALK